MQASDVYSFGILLFEVASGQKPYPGRTVKEVMRDVVQHKLRPQIVVNLPRWGLLCARDGCAETVY